MAALAFGVSACGDDDDEGEEAAAPPGGEAQLDLVIGDVVPLTGALSPFGPAGRKAADLAFDEIEAAIKEVKADHTVELIHEDEQTDPQAAVQAARSLVGDGATCIAGAWASADTIPISRSVATREEVVQISPASSSALITDLEDDGFTNRTITPDDFQADILADHIAKELGGAEGKVLNVGSRNDAYGEGFVLALGESWEELGGEIGEEVIYDPELPSYNSEAEQIVSGNPDGTVIIDFPETYGKVGPALVRTGDFDPETAFITDGLADTTLPKTVGEEATEGMSGSTLGTPAAKGPAVESFDNLFTQAPGPERQSFDAQNFDAVMLCYLAAVAAGSTDGTAIRDQLQGVSGPPGTVYGWPELPQAVEALQNGEDIDYDGASGPIDLGETGDATGTIYRTVEFRNGKLVELDTFPVGAAAE